MRIALAIIVASVAAILFAAGAAPPLIHGMQASHQTIDFGATMSSMPGYASVAAEVEPGPTNAGNSKLDGALIGIGLFGLLLSGSLVIRPRISGRVGRSRPGVGNTEINAT